MPMRVDNTLEAIKAKRKAYSVYNAPRMSDYVWYALGKVRLLIHLTQIKLDNRMGAATWKVQQYRATMKNHDYREKIAKEAHCNGGCAK